MTADHDRLAQNLRAALQPAVAPDGLWARIQAPAPARHHEALPTRLLWPVIALLLLLASADLLWEFSRARGSLRQIAQPTAADLSALATSPDACDLYSNDPAHIRKWVKSRTGIEIQMPDHTSAIRLVGARVADVRGTLVASLKYETVNEARKRAGTLLVWKDGRPSTGGHVVSDRMAGSEMVSWSQGENVFAAVPVSGASASAVEASAKDACLLCHPI